MLQPPSSVQADFDRIALATESVGGRYNERYHNLLLRYLPQNCREALEIGCGTGGFSRYLARRSDHVVALDLSPQMIRVAREQSRDYPNIDFEVADVIAWDFPAERFDCIVSISTLHHLPLRPMLKKMQNALRAGGIMLILDLYQNVGPLGRLADLVAYPIYMAQQLAGRQLKPPRAVTEAWDHHGQHDSYLTISQARQIYTSILPGAKVTKHLLWRYSVVYRKPPVQLA
jgi:SAM-dependent methyltransferase